MASIPLVGVDYSEDDRYSGPFRIRVGGSNDYVIKIDPDDRWCSPPGSVEYGAGCDGAMVFDDFDEALSAAASVFEIDGVHVSVMAYGIISDRRTDCANLPTGLTN